MRQWIGYKEDGEPGNPDGHLSVEFVGTLRKTLLQGDGILVLGWLWQLLGMWDKIETEEDRVRHNIGIEIMEALDVYHVNNLMATLREYSKLRMWPNGPASEDERKSLLE